MKIAIIGYGKMGRLVEEVARKRGNDISIIIDVNDTHHFSSPEFRHSDVAIEFTTPSSAADGVLKAFSAGVPVVSGTTGWLEELQEIKTLCEEGKGSLLYSSNFSIGMNIYLALASKLAKMMESFPGYKPRLEEIHHIHKLDKPSGTAITIAETVMENNNNVAAWLSIEEGLKSPEDVIGIYSKREGEEPGIHTLSWESEYDILKLTHEAKNRLGFAEGAVMVAEWLAHQVKEGNKGFFTIHDVLGF